MKLWRWIGGAAAGAALAGASFVGWVYAASEAHLRSFPNPAAFDHPIPTDAAALARGERLTLTRGCRGCHGEHLQGELMWGVAVAPNLPALARDEDAAAFERALRHGVGHDGRALYSMPSYNFVHLRDQDVADLYAYLRQAPVAHAELPRPHLPFAIRYEIAMGRDAAMPQWLGRVPPLTRQHDPDPRIARGEYLAMTSCNECHGFGLRADTPWGPEEGAAPDLTIVGSYPEADFRRLMHDGVAIGDRELPMMSGVARGRFSHLTDEEVGDLYAFLQDFSARALAETAP